MKKIFMLLLVALFCAIGVNAATITVSADITTNTTWTNNNVYVLTGGFRYVKNNATLTIQAGTLIKGTASSLVITRGAKIIAIGTEYQPIVFTSSQPAGSRNPSDWGGVLILGNAPINDPAGSRLAEGGIDPTLGLYGGTNPADNSGTMQYCRIEYAGIAYQPNNETNGLTLGGVGSGTVIDHIQVSHGGDDSFEWFGGTVNAKYLIAYRGLDDDFDTDYGFNGKVQFGVGLRDSAIADVSGSNGFESDNDATGTTNLPNTNATFSNMTLFGPKVTNTTTVNANYKRAAHLRRSTQQDIYNTVFTGWVNGLKIEGTATAANVTSGALQFKNNVLAGISSLVLDSSALNFGMGSWFNANSNTTYPNPQDVLAGNPYNYTAPTFLPTSGSPILVGADFTAANLQDPFFTPVNYKGAFGTTNWTSCWSEFNPQSQAYTTGPITYLTVPVITYTGATTFCTGLTKTLTAPAGFASYLWSNGATTQSIVVSTSGSYSVTVTNTRGCVATSAPVVITVTPGPTASVAVSGATTFCTGGSALLTGSSNTAGVSYQWLNNGTNISNATTPYYNATASGVYSLKVTKNGCVGNSTSTTVTANVNPTAAITGTLSVCNGSATTLSATTGTGLSYQWNQGGSAISGATSSTYSATSGGSYTVDVTNNTTGCATTSAAATVVATNLSLVTTASNTGVICGLTPVTLTATTISGATYEWYRNGQIIAGAVATTYAASTSGSYYAKATKSGCSVFSSSLGISSQTTPAITASATTVCSGVSVSLTASTGSSYQWYNNGAVLAGATNINYATTTAGSYTVKVGACTSNATSVTVNPLPTATITAGGSLAFCLGNNVTLNGNTGTGLAYQWRKATSNIAGATSASYIANTTGSYTVRVTNTTTGCTKTSTAVTVTANAVPATPTITRNGLVFTSNASTGNQWFKNGVAISGATATTYTATTVGCYHTRVSNASGCTSSSDTLCVASVTPPSVSYPGQNGNSIEWVNEEVSLINMNVVPNPNNGVFELNIQNNEATTDAKLMIFNVMGQNVYSQNIAVQTGESAQAIRLDNISNGVYFVRLLFNNKVLESKIVVNK